uniref:uncharacterized protein LOC120332706 n=1 Tax=Styela clava TaxID=7725 RepID=UPI0019394B19|nr:uncharacterized protein LOC120332706 [Styela clava]
MLKLSRIICKKTHNVWKIRANMMSQSQIIDKDIRLDFCSTKEEREEFYKIAGESFFISSISLRYLPDEEKRKQFLPAYFRYLHEEQIATGKATLMALKKRENIEGKEVWKTAYSGVYAYDTTPTEHADASGIMEIYEEGAEAMIKRDKWFEENIDGPLRDIALKFGTAAWLMARQAVTKEYKNQNYGLKYSRFSTNIAYEMGLKKHAESNNSPFKYPPFEYVASSDTFPGGMKLMEKSGMYAAAHLHYDHKPGLKCYLDSEEKNRSKHSCYFIMVDKKIHPVLKEELNKTFNKAKL